MFQLCFNLYRIHDSVEKAFRTVNQVRVTANSHAFLSSFHPGFRDVWLAGAVRSRLLHSLRGMS